MDDWNEEDTAATAASFKQYLWSIIYMPASLRYRNHKHRLTSDLVINEGGSVLLICFAGALWSATVSTLRTLWVRRSLEETLG